MRVVEQNLARASRLFQGNVPVRSKDGIVHWEHPDWAYALCDRSRGTQRMWDEARTMPVETPVTCIPCLAEFHVNGWPR